MIIHKLISVDNKKRYLCNQAVDPSFNKGTRINYNVTCKNCLRGINNEK